MVHRRPANWNVQESVKSVRRPYISNVNAARRGTASLTGGRDLAVQLRQQSLQIPQALRPGGVLEGLVLGEDVDEPLPHLVAVPAEQLRAGLAELLDDVADIAVRREAVRHWAAARLFSGRRGGHAIAPALPPALRPGSSAPGARLLQPGR